MSKLISSIPEQIIVKLKNSEKMKKLTGMKSNFSSLENKKMKNLQFIQGGDQTSQCQESTVCGSSCADTAYYTDGVKTKTLYVGEPS
ncbi:TIGR04139 family peptide modification target [Chryseobacterium gossypii]|uniref:TIGR04139 family peptide modification target n=1 Tax=Chryseobacterium gossypii TaxID=3231602 RepID=UPI0035262D1D